MKIEQRSMFVGVVVLGLVAALPAPGASEPNSTGVPTQMVITVQPSHAGGSIPQDLQARDVTVLEGNTRVPVLGVERLAGERAEMQLFVLLDDSTRSSSLGIQLPELKTFVQSLPASAQVAVGYMHNGTFALAQAFTADHQKAAAALRLPAAIPGENGSPYFALSDLVKHWPSKEPTGRRAVLMLTDGVDRYYSGAIVDDPYVDAAIQDASKSGVTVSAIYLRGAGFYGRRDWPTTIAQSRLQQVTDETGGYAYFEGITDPVSITPFLNDFRDRLDHQYQLTFAALPHGMQPVKLKTEMPGIKIEGPTRVYVR